jgi:hypothetical protein
MAAAAFCQIVLMRRDEADATGSHVVAGICGMNASKSAHQLHLIARASNRASRRTINRRVAAMRTAWIVTLTLLLIALLPMRPFPDPESLAAVFGGLVGVLVMVIVHTMVVRTHYRSH